MSTPPRPTDATPRRDFLGKLATAAVAVAGTAYAGASATDAAAALQTPAPDAGVRPADSPAAQPDDAWFARITGKHKAVFDAPEIADGTIVANAWVFLKSYTEVHSLTDQDLSAVLVIRHAAIPLAFDDEFWAKYDVGKTAKLEDPATGKWARRNIHWKAAPGATSTPGAFTLDALRSRGAILVGCALAADRRAREIAKRTSQSDEAVMAEMRAHLIPGLELAHSGIYAVTRAQEAGCTYIRST